VKRNGLNKKKHKESEKLEKLPTETVFLRLTHKLELYKSRVVIDPSGSKGGRHFWSLPDKRALVFYMAYLNGKRGQSVRGKKRSRTLSLLAKLSGTNPIEKTNSIPINDDR